jgi:hypothetical protein
VLGHGGFRAAVGIIRLAKSYGRDRVDRGVGACADLDRPAAGCFQPLIEDVDFRTPRRLDKALFQQLASAVNYTVADGRSIVWKLPVYNTVHHILTNPIYGGA